MDIHKLFLKFKSQKVLIIGDSMIKIVFVLIYITSLYSITGLEIAQKMENRAKPIDIKSKYTMILTIKKGKKKTSKLFL